VAEPGYDAAGSPIEVVPVVVLSQVFTARPSSIPDIRDFVRRCLAESPLTDQGNREVGETVFRALLKAAGPTGSIQVAFRIFPEHVEVDVLHSDTVIQPPTIPGPPVATMVPGQASAADNARSQLSQASYLTEAIRPGQPGGSQAGAHPGAGGPGSYGPAGAHGGPDHLVAPAASAGFGAPGSSRWLTGVPAAPDGPDRPDGAGPTRSAGQQAETFAAWMSSALRREGLTQEAAARQLGVSVKTVSRWVGGATEPRMRDLRRIQELFGEVPIP
jgi:DNA-binding XRE family transcriptional regulator